MATSSGFKPLIDHLSTIWPLSDSTQHFITEYFVAEDAPKGTILLSAGEYCERKYFVVKGLLRQFFTDEHQDLTTRFAQENDWLFPAHSFLTRQPSRDSIEVLQDAHLLSIHYKDLHYLYNACVEFDAIDRKLTEHYWVQNCELEHVLRSKRLLERYQFAEQLYPHIFSRAPLAHIASYLGMTTDELTCLRAEMN